MQLKESIKVDHKDHIDIHFLRSLEEGIQGMQGMCHDLDQKQQDNLSV